MPPIQITFNTFNDPLTFHSAPSLGQNINVSDALVYDQIPEKECCVPNRILFSFLLFVHTAAALTKCVLFHVVFI